MECQRCGREIENTDQKFCDKCGWDLGQEIPVPKDEIAPVPRKCPNCGSNELDKFTRPTVCPVCGAYVGFNRGILHIELIKLAQAWTRGSYNFFIEVLKLPNRTARALQYSGIQPLEALALREDEALSIRNFGNKSYDALDTARTGWEPKTG